MVESLLTITNIGLPPFSARGCKQELIPISNGEFRKTINGELVFLKVSNIQKYKTIIRGSDTNCPAIGNIWIGSQINIACIQNIWQSYQNSNEKIILSRQPVNDSVFVINKNGEKIKCVVHDTNVSLEQDCDGEIFVAFRPWITAIVTDFHMETNEWDLSTNWTLVAEEI